MLIYKMSHTACVFTILSVLGIIQFGECNPRCYICDSQSNPECVHPEKNNLETQQCLINNLQDMRTTVDKLGLARLATYFEIEIDRTDFNAPLNCVKAVSQVHGKEIVLRGCQLAPKGNLDVCKKLLDEEKEMVQHCSLCNEDGCNSAPNVIFSPYIVGLITILIAVM